MNCTSNRGVVLMMTALLAVLILAVTGCTGSPSAGAADKAANLKVEGTYTNPEGNASVEFMAGGKAHFSFHGVGGDGTFKQAGNKVTFAFDGEVIVFTVYEDGSLTGPPDTFMTRMKKKKE